MASKNEEPSLAGILKELDKSPPAPSTPEEKKKAEMAALPDPEKWRKAWGWRMQGVPMSAIAKMFDVDVRTINRWIARLKQEFRESFEGESAADCLSGHLMKLESLEEACRYEANQLSKDGKEFDPTTGQVVESKNIHQQKGTQAKFLKIALDCEVAQIKMLQEVGILPTKEPERMYRSMAEEGKSAMDEEQDVVIVPKDRKESIGELIKALQNGRNL